ncbi:MAG: SGNH/GDSL hydrolase family protein [Muribaculaceae bacterium]|nr:SGNH/GDSL hydrolase family protein [Muribaculaceae bacterium]
MFKTFSPLRLFFLILAVSFGMMSGTGVAQSKSDREIKKGLLIGDSMAGWLGQRLNAYGQKNGFEVGTIVWDGATIQKYANNSNLKKIIETQDPDVVFVCLGMNNLGESNPSRLKPFIDKIKESVGDRELVWIGPPTWPSKPTYTKLNPWLEEEIGKGRYFNSFPLTLARQSKTNPHPTREGIVVWGDAIAKWLETTDLNFPSMQKPSGTPLVKGNYYLYKRMKESL